MDDFLLTGIWRLGQGARYVWYGADWPSFLTKHNSQVASGYVLNSLDVAQGSGPPSWSGVWESGSVPQQLISNLTWNDLLQQNALLTRQGMSLTSVRAYPASANPLWVALWRSGPAPTTLVGPSSWDEFWLAWLAQHAAGNRLIDFDTIEIGGQRRWAGLWQPGTGDQYLWVGVPWESLAAKNTELLAGGYNLSRVRSYSDGSVRQWAAHWTTVSQATSLVADLAVPQFWSEWDTQLTRGFRLAQLHAWPGTGYAPQPALRNLLRLHFKILAVPTIPMSTMLDRMREVYEPAGFVIEVASTENVNQPDLLDLNAGSCTPDSITAAQQELFAERTSAGANDVVVYFVRSTLPPYNGCAAHPDGRPGAVVTSYASEWTLGHEVGHVLGLIHVADTHRLMTGLGTGNITNPPPELVSEEIAIMRSSPYVSPM